jgi:hypothetical protein
MGWLHMKNFFLSFRELNWWGVSFFLKKDVVCGKRFEENGKGKKALN